MSKIYRSTGEGTGAWTLVPDGTDISRSTGSGNSWTNPVSIWRSTGSGTDNWTKVWSKSDPVKYTFVANRSKYFRHTDGSWGSSPSAASLRTGAWNVDCGGGTYSNSTYVGVFGFSTESGGQTLAQVLAERPYVTSAAPTAGGSAENSIKLRRQTPTYTGYGSAYGTWYLGKYTGDTTDGSPDADDCNQTGKISKTLASGSPITAGGYLTYTPSVSEMQVLADHMDTNPLWITNKNSIANIKANGGFINTEYLVFYGTGETTPPTLTLTLDYVAP